MIITKHPCIVRDVFMVLQFCSRHFSHNGGSVSSRSRKRRRRGSSKINYRNTGFWWGHICRWEIQLTIVKNCVTKGLISLLILNQMWITLSAEIRCLWSIFPSFHASRWIDNWLFVTGNVHCTSKFYLFIPVHIQL